jgi:type VI secretion system protein VasD
MRWSRSLLPLVCSFALAVGCSSGPPLLRGAINADGSVNPDRGGRASPIVVRVYELKSVAAFNTADFFSLFDKEQETLGGELVGREEFQLQPAETRQYRRQLQPDTKFFGVVAAFRDLEQSRWRQAVPVPAKGSATLTLGIQARAITLAVK